VTSEFRSGILLCLCPAFLYYHRYLYAPDRTPCHEVVRPETDYWLTPTSQPLSASVWGRSDGRLGGTRMLPTIQRVRRSVTSSSPSTSLQNRWVDISTREHVILQNRIADIQSYKIPKFSSLHMILIQFNPCTSMSSNWPISKPYSYHSLYTFTFRISLLRATCPTPPTVIIYQPESLYPGDISYINPLFFFLAHTLLFCK